MFATGTGLYPPVFTGTFPSGGLFFSSYVTVTTTPYPVTATDQCIDVDPTATNIVIDLPAASAGLRWLRIARSTGGANTVTIDAAGADTINGAGTYLLPIQYQTVDLVSNGVSWRIF